jgi:hypothetical protein
MVDSAFQRSALDLRFARLDALREAVDDLLRQRPRLITPGLMGRVRPSIRGHVDCGLQSVPIYKVVSSNGRYADFDRWFPQRANLDQSFTGATPQRSGFRPVELYKVGAVYLVKDGNYRVASARARGQLFLPAQVTEIVIDTSLEGLADARDVLLTEEYYHFLEVTGLAQLRPTQQVECGTLGNYTQIVRHIDDHHADLQTDWDRAIKRNVAAASWYDTIYMPIINLVRRQRILDFFPAYHESDIYVWAMEHRLVRRVQAFQQLASGNRFRERLKDALSDVIALARAHETHTLQTVVRV